MSTFFNGVLGRSFRIQAIEYCRHLDIDVSHPTGQGLRPDSIHSFLSVAFGSITALAVEGQTTDIWDGTADTSWYTGHETESEYHITTAEQLAGLAQLINTGTITFEGKTVYLDNDLDLDKREDIHWQR